MPACIPILIAKIPAIQTERAFYGQNINHSNKASVILPKYVSSNSGVACLVKISFIQSEGALYRQWKYLSSNQSERSMAKIPIIQSEQALYRHSANHLSSNQSKRCRNRTRSFALGHACSRQSNQSVRFIIKKRPTYQCA